MHTLTYIQNWENAVGKAGGHGRIFERFGILYYIIVSFSHTCGPNAFGEVAQNKNRTWPRQKWLSVEMEPAGTIAERRAGH